MIWKNFVRDLRHTACRLISVSIITMIAVVVYTGLSGIIYNMDAHLGDYYRGAECGGLLDHGHDLDQGDCRTLEAYRRDDRGSAPGSSGCGGAVRQHLTLPSMAWPGLLHQHPLCGGGVSSRRPAVRSSSATSTPPPTGWRWGTGMNSPSDRPGTHLRLRICGVGKDPECLYHINATNRRPRSGPVRLRLCGRGGGQRGAGAQPVHSDLHHYRRGPPLCASAPPLDGALWGQGGQYPGSEGQQPAYSLHGDRENLAPILNVFPALFFLCAVLMMVSTMNRLIENARSDIGTFKALGY